MANIVTAQELGQYLKLSESTINKLALDGKLPGFKIGDSWRLISMRSLSSSRNQQGEWQKRERDEDGGQ